MTIRPAGPVIAISLLAVAGTSAQQWPLHYPQPPAGAVRVTRDVQFATAGTSRLAMDVYRPANGAGPFPAVIFYMLYWPAEGASDRSSSDWYRSWARLAAANGIVAILPDLRAQPGTGNATSPARALGDDFQTLVSHITASAAAYGVDADRIAVFAESGSTWSALPAVEDPTQTGVKAAVIYYGGANIETFRRDLPLLWVRAGLDSERTNATITRLASLALSQNAPLTLVNHPTGQHAFEGRDDNAVTREVIEQTLAFIKRATMREFQAAIRQESVAAR